jgi:hypothetical protein
MVERTHHQIEYSLRSRLVGVDWPLHLPEVSCGLRAAPKEDSVVSSAELVFGASLTLLGEILISPELACVKVVQLLRQLLILLPQPLHMYRSQPRFLSGLMDAK